MPEWKRRRRRRRAYTAAFVLLLLTATLVLWPVGAKTEEGTPIRCGSLRKAHPERLRREFCEQLGVRRRRLVLVGIAGTATVVSLAVALTIEYRLRHESSADP